MSHKMSRAACVLLLSLGLIACKPTPPPTDEPPEPQATAATATELRDAVHEPLDKAKAVEETVQKAADQQRAAIDEQAN